MFIIRQAIFKIIKTVVLCLLILFPGKIFSAVEETNSFSISSVIINGKSSSVKGHKITLGLFYKPRQILFLFPINTNVVQSLPRIRFKLDGYENNWRDAPDSMSVAIRFLNSAGDQVGQNIFPVSGESAGWSGSIQTSPLTHRREVITVPMRATRLTATISSAGSASSVGVYVVADFMISRTPVTVNYEQAGEATSLTLSGWKQDGLHKSMAEMVSVGDGLHKAFAIIDKDKTAHAEWHTSALSSPAIVPGEQLIMEWNEMFSVGDGNFFQSAYYENLPEGKYVFHVAECDVYGNPTKNEMLFNVVILPIFWQTSWFWIVFITVLCGVFWGGSRYLTWYKIRREIISLKSQQKLYKERLRIAQDIHDDLGARITQISLLSATAPDRGALSAQAHQDFEKIFQMSNGLIFALYETVWAINPEKDNLEALGSYICQQVAELCKVKQLHCRFDISNLPAHIQISSQIRHNIYLAAKEAVNNVIKHANASEITIQIKLVNDCLVVSIRDNGCGLVAGKIKRGNGLANIENRMNNIGGAFLIESSIGHGTVIHLQLDLASSGVSSQ